MSDIPARPSAFDEVFARVREARKRPEITTDRWGPEVDEAALLMASRVRDRLLGKFTLTYSEWTQLTAQIQGEFALAIRHAAYDPPPFPGTPAMPLTNPWRLTTEP